MKVDIGVRKHNWLLGFGYTPGRNRPGKFKFIVRLYVGPVTFYFLFIRKENVEAQELGATPWV